MTAAIAQGPDARAWVRLVSSAQAAAATPDIGAETLASAVQSVCGKVLPAARLPDQCAFEALRSLGRAYAKAGDHRRSRLAAPLAVIADECAELLTLQPPSALPPPTNSAGARSWLARADCGDA